MESGLRPPTDFAHIRLDSRELSLRTPGFPVKQRRQSTQKVTISEDWAYGFPLGVAQVFSWNEGACEIFTLNTVTNGVWFASNSIGTVARFSSSEVIEQAVWCGEWFYEKDAWFGNWSKVAMYRISEFRIAMRQFAMENRIILPESWLLEEDMVTKLKRPRTSLSHEDQVTQILFSEGKFKSNRNPGLQFLWFLASRHSARDLCNDSVIAEYLVLLEETNGNASCLDRATRAIRMLTELQTDSIYSGSNLLISKSVINSLRKLHKSQPKSVLLVEAWMARDVLFVYVWNSDLLWAKVFGHAFAATFKHWCRYDCIRRTRFDESWMVFFPSQNRSMWLLDGCKNNQYQGLWMDCAAMPNDTRGVYHASLEVRKQIPNGHVIPHMYKKNGKVIIDTSKPMSRETFVLFAREALHRIGIDKETCSKLTAKSFRRGAASHGVLQQLSTADISHCSRTSSTDWIAYYDQKSLPDRLELQYKMGV